MAAPAKSKHLILYDGVCHLCDRLNRFVLPRDPEGVFRFASIQSATGSRILQANGKNPRDLDTLYVVRNYEFEDSMLLAKATAGLFVLGTLGWPWRTATVLRILPTSLLNWGYDRIAKNRYRIFGRHESCLMPSPEYKGRFVDV